MLAVNYSTIRNNLKDYCDKVTDKHETVIVTRKDEKNVVIISLEKYNQLEKAARNAEYLAMIDRGITQLESGHGQEHELIEVDEWKKLWSDRAWDDYLYWQTQDKKTLKRINELVKSIERERLSQGIGKPEPLKHRKAWSRRIDETNRLVYNVDENGFLWIIACKGHYED